MDTKEAKKIVDYVFNDVFGVENPLSLEETRDVLAYDIPLPEKVKSMTGNDYTWGIFDKNEKIMSFAENLEQSGKTDFMLPKKKLSSVSDILKEWEKLDYHVGGRYLDSKEVLESDGIYESSSIYRSSLQFGCQNMAYCYMNNNSKYLIASRDNSASVSGIRFNQNKYCSSGYDVIWSSKVSKSMYVRDSVDLYECLFCTSLKSKKYCIANMQFEKEEYLKIKKMVIDWTVGELKKRASK
jgi:hypothetical protein